MKRSFKPSTIISFQFNNLLSIVTSPMCFHDTFERKKERKKCIAKSF